MTLTPIKCYFPFPLRFQNEVKALAMVRQEKLCKHKGIRHIQFLCVSNSCIFDLPVRVLLIYFNGSNTPFIYSFIIITDLLIRCSNNSN